MQMELVETSDECPFDVLPPEAVLEVLLQMSLKDLGNFTTSCKRFRSVMALHRPMQARLVVKNVELLITDTGITTCIVFNSKGHLLYTDFGRHSLISFNLETKTKTPLIKADVHNLMGDHSYNDGPLEGAVLTCPHSLLLDDEDNIYCSDSYNHTIRKISAKDNTIETVAGVPSVIGYKDGKALESLFHYPFGMVFDADGGIIVCDDWNHCLRKLCKDGTVVTIGGHPEKKANKNGPLKESQILYPGYIAKKPGTETLFFAVEFAIRVIKKGVVSTLWNPVIPDGYNIRITGIAFDHIGDLYFSLAESRSDDRTTVIHESEGIYKMFFSTPKRYIVRLRLTKKLDNIFALQYYNKQLYFKGTTSDGERCIFKMDCL